MNKISKFKKLSLAIATLVVGLALMPSVASAVTCTSNTACTAPGETCIGYEAAVVGGAAEKLGNCGKDTFGLSGISNTGLGQASLLSTASKIINVALSLLGLIAVVIVLAGGFKWMTAGGNEEKTTEARKMIFAGIIGLAIILSAWSITLFVFNQLQKATGSGTIPTGQQQGL